MGKVMTVRISEYTEFLKFNKPGPGFLTKKSPGEGVA